MNRTVVFLLVIFAMTASSYAQDITPVPCKTWEAIDKSNYLTNHSPFVKATRGDGTVNKRAVVSTLWKGPLRISVAIDSDEPNAKVASIIRFDFTGRGVFDDKLVAPLMNIGRSQVDFETTLEIRYEGKCIPVTVAGFYQRRNRHIHLELGTAIEGSCQFGQKTHKVRIIDGGELFHFGDIALPTREIDIWSPSEVLKSSGDTVVVDIGDGTFKRLVTRGYYGHPIFVDDTWYEVLISPDGDSISAKPLAGPMSEIRVNQQSWSCIMVNDSYILRIGGSEEPVSIPAGEYTIPFYHTGYRNKNGRPEISLSGLGPLDSQNEDESFEFKAGEVTEVKLGTPLTAIASATQRDNLVDLSVKIVDVNGREIRGLSVFSRP